MEFVESEEFSFTLRTLQTPRTLQTFVFLRRGERNADVARRADKLSVGVDVFDICNGFGKRHGNDAVCLERDHFSVFAVCQSANRARAEIRAEHSVERVGRAAALQVSENDAARFLAGNFLDSLPDVIADAAQSRRARHIADIFVDFAFPDFHRAFGNDDIRKKRAAFFARGNFLNH